MTPAELKAHRQRLGLTQAQLAEALGLRPNTYARWEGGFRTPRMAAMLKQALAQLERGGLRRRVPASRQRLQGRPHRGATGAPLPEQNMDETLPALDTFIIQTGSYDEPDLRILQRLQSTDAAAAQHEGRPPRTLAEVRSAWLAGAPPGAKFLYLCCLDEACGCPGAYSTHWPPSVAVNYAAAVVDGLQQLAASGCRQAAAQRAPG